MTVHDVEEQFAVQVKVENGEQSGVESGQAPRSGEQQLFGLSSWRPPYQLMESSNSSSVGSSGSSCMTVNM